MYDVDEVTGKLIAQKNADMLYQKQTPEEKARAKNATVKKQILAEQMKLNGLTTKLMVDGIFDNRYSFFTRGSCDVPRGSCVRRGGVMKWVSLLSVSKNLSSPRRYIEDLVKEAAKEGFTRGISEQVDHANSSYNRLKLQSWKTLGEVNANPDLNTWLKNDVGCVHYWIGPGPVVQQNLTYTEVKFIQEEGKL